MTESFHGTTILCVRRGQHVVMIGDGQVTLGSTVVKDDARKVRRLGGGEIISGFAGSTADAFALFEKFEGKLKEHPGQLVRAAVELAKEWRTDRALRRLEALLIVADADSTLMISGSGDVIEPEEGIAAIGSGGMYALAAARALIRHQPAFHAGEVAQYAMEVASEICVYTNRSFTTEELNPSEKENEDVE